MRLNAEQSSAIVGNLKSFLPIEFEGQLLLFGSQTDDQAKGGDIDLALIVKSPSHLYDLQQNDFKILAKIKAHPRIGDRKLDLHI